MSYHFINYVLIIWSYSFTLSCQINVTISNRSFYAFHYLLSFTLSFIIFYIRTIHYFSRYVN